MSEKKMMYAGMGVAEINPPVGLPLAGFPGERANTGVGPMDLCARALVAGEAADKPQAAIVVLDNLGIGADIVARVRDAMAEAVAGLATEAIMVCATHTHSAPALRRFGGARPGKSPAVNEAYVEKIIASSAAAAAAAWKAAVKVSLSVGCGQARLHHNRRVVGPDGKATNEWLDPDGAHTGVTNPDVPFAIFRDESGRVAWVLGSYACHPVTMGPPNIEASPDYPGGFVAAAREKLGAREAMFITGPGADINPIEALGTDHEVPRRVGATLAAEVADRLNDAEAIDASPIKACIRPLTLELGPEARENYSNRAADAGDPTRLATEVQAVRLGELTVVSAPGELFTEIGMAIEKASPAAHTLVASFTNDYLGYLFTDKALKEGGYEPRNAISLDIEKPLIAAAVAAIEEVMG